MKISKHSILSKKGFNLNAIPQGLGGSLPLIFCIHVRLEPIYWGGYLPCRRDYKVMVFYM